MILHLLVFKFLRVFNLYFVDFPVLQKISYFMSMSLVVLWHSQKSIYNRSHLEFVCYKKKVLHVLLKKGKKPILKGFEHLCCWLLTQQQSSPGCFVSWLMIFIYLFFFINILSTEVAALWTFLKSALLCC